MARKTKFESGQTRERLLDAAEMEMLEHGVTQTSLERIATHAEVTRGAIYWHFSDKTALLEAMLARTKLPLRDLRRCLGEKIPNEQPQKLLREMLLHGMQRLASDEQHRRVCHIVLHRCETPNKGHPTERLLTAMFEESRDALLSLCREIADAGQLRPGLAPEDAADVILAFLCGLYECSLRHSALYSADHHGECRIDALLSGLFHPEPIHA